MSRVRIYSKSSTFKSGDIFLGDKGFCNYYDIDSLSRLGVDSVVTLKRRKPASSGECIKKLGTDDLLISWKRPVYSKKSSYSKEQWQKLAPQLHLRQIKVTVNQPGFRIRQFYIITTLCKTTTEKLPVSNCPQT